MNMAKPGSLKALDSVHPWALDLEDGLPSYHVAMVLGKSGDAKIHPRTPEVQDKCHQMSVVLASWLRLLFTFCRIQHENEKRVCFG